MAALPQMFVSCYWSLIIRERFPPPEELPRTFFPFFYSPAVYFELQKWEECIKQCEEAVEKGRELRADFKVIAKCVVGSIGNIGSSKDFFFFVLLICGSMS